MPKVTCDGLTCQLDGTSSTDASQPAIDHSWDMGDGKTETGATGSHTYEGPGTYTVTLTVKDNEGGSASASKTVTVVAAATQVEFHKSVSALANGTAVRLDTPATTLANDGMVLIASGNRSDVTYGSPGAGWTEVRRIADNDLVTIVWQRVADDADAGKRIEVTSSLTAKLDLQLLVYRGTDRNTPVIGSAAAVEPGTSASHTTPVVQAPQGAVVLSYWADKTSATTNWTAPNGTTVRTQSVGSGSGRLTSLGVDQEPRSAAGSAGGLTATADAASGKATMFTIVVGARPDRGSAWQPDGRVPLPEVSQADRLGLRWPVLVGVAVAGCSAEAGSTQSGSTSVSAGTTPPGAVLAITPGHLAGPRSGNDHPGPVRPRERRKGGRAGVGCPAGDPGRSLV